MKKIVIATKNPGKVREIKDAFAHLPVEVLSLGDFGQLPNAIEDGETFAENAAIKAKFYMEKTGCACLADDSGLEVAALGGRPGVYSARFAGYNADDWSNNQKMLEEICIADVEESRANYRCALCFVDTDGHKVSAEGRCDGVIKKIPHGNGGFGYDPYFYTNEYAGRTMAELTLEEKNRISHRGRALRKLVQQLEDVL
ncbi:MAG: XTP/dITP diphosphatase [Selenomonas sp.]|nr:XTP/dITP diphosphatase [Selenomonas sp.]MBQ5418596.1 XTP/dITP diphosphatase [Selenomonas sp.]